MAPALAGRYYLGLLCGKAHRYEGSDFTLRKRSNRGCVACNRQYPRHRTNGHKPQLPGVPARPALPAHLAAYAFLSPIVCAVEQHRYRNSPFTLRYIEDETCVRCRVQAATPGD